MTPQSFAMSRKDSGNPIEDHKIFQSAAPSAQFTPSKQFSSTMSPFGSVFTPTKAFGTSQASNSSPFNSFYTPGQGSAMKMLNLGSTPDGPSTKSSFSSVKPIGSCVSSPSRHSSLMSGPGFSTDADPNLVETRFVRFGMLPGEWTQEILNEVLSDAGLEHLVDNAVTAEGDTPYTFSLYCRFDDLRAASSSKIMFESVFRTVSFRFVDHHEYFAIDRRHPRAQSVSAYDGQVVFTAMPMSMMDFNLSAIHSEVYTLAEAFGNVRMFSYVEPDGFEAPRFRAEYFSVKSAETAVSVSVQNEAPYTCESVTVSVKQYEPPGYVRYAHPAAQGGIAQLEAATQALELYDDFDDRLENKNNYYNPRSHKDEYAPRSHGNHGAHRSRGGRGSYRGRPSDAPQRAWWVPSDDSIVHQTDVEFWRFNQPQTVNLLKIHDGIDVRTTIMLRNVPNRVQFEDLKMWLDETSAGHYDFSYLRIDFSNNFNVGYAFVNFCKPEYITNFVQKRVGHPWSMYGSLKKCEVSYATIQGIDCLLAKFRNSVVMEETPAFRPKLWYNIESTDLPIDEETGLPDYRAIGTEAPFPPPNNEQKRKRSRDNAGTIGLFPPRRGKGPYGPDAHHREGQYDRGTSFAIEEERQFEEQRQVRFNERRQLGHRGQGRHQYPAHRDDAQGHPARRGGGGYQQRPARRIGGAPQEDSHDPTRNDYEEDDFFDENDAYFHENRGSRYRRGHYRQ
ncbi:hypothetical protein AUEXF2481DRAFT_610513 [Aureobasidium subglaciale EXF-2481]|uniref:Mei2-like C-terminal RNA recognition motif domain-containing protein n=1 Tax=Aureobasidium subglaciale (strain EXF-2481) TaxID=1043005 RepID=A0A074YG94_AURSE|nr:uncharacterized protein AUEXF2481DRAFT_610513 [Aureobasidium subglaciale EXF-2481]KAI5209371.1 hypothetical protein E4T38_02513 [Aureobasidium subglaciale]KAI5228120.1 hypothetical protein E4T40_02292 [Aureobasidium subglaciale]KAI5231463.1 hypothetical protein E4T41_02512 [Aureobasidium subglaciale]KAI5265538.1 hypothetical protein E4T46_02290 [Aureobasidium subglaciale]KEQ96740.1 hypothetical protein AUEXF2481DRAFT_610513 [Aureobasidium subglaciale EXF-2481]